MEDGLGLSGVEGVFRRVSEVAMNVLRANSETLLSVLEAFVDDPLVEWTRRGRQQQGKDRTSSDKSKDASWDKQQAQKILDTTKARLGGVYNYGVRKDDLDGSLPLSVQGHVHRLIQEASSEDNLLQM
jgi:serine/threonine-protein kinase ATR